MMVSPDPDSKSNSPDWDAWRESLAIALQGQYGSAKTWTTVSEQARDGWRSDAAEVMASIPGTPIPWHDEHAPYRYRDTGDAFCRTCGMGWPCRAACGDA